jgi:hypothetical protein
MVEEFRVLTYVSITDGEGLRQRHTNTTGSNGVAPKMKEGVEEESDDKIASDLVFDIQTLISVQTDFQ